MPGPRTWRSATPWLYGGRWLALALLLLQAVPVLAENPEAPVVETAEGVLIMRETGAVMSGLISQNGDWYLVEGQHGKVSVPADRVKMRCTSLQHAYTRLHDQTVSRQSADAHLTLARWCVTYDLNTEAIEELKAALELEPERNDVRRMLDNLTEASKTVRKTAVGPESEESPRVSRPDAPVADESSTLGGLSRPLALQYTRRIQPMLVKTCATNGCHTRDSDSGFQLNHVVPGKHATRHPSEQNLAAVLEQIDIQKPESSRLLTMTRGKHGRQGRPVFSGLRGEEQRTELEQWVLDVARSESRRGKLAEGDGSRKAEARQTSGTQPAIDRVGNRDPFAGKQTSPSANLRGERREQAIADNLNDPFDPAAFNRQQSGRSRR
jgi:hypothetical protein